MQLHSQRIALVALVRYVGLRSNNKWWMHCTTGYIHITQYDERIITFSLTADANEIASPILQTKFHLVTTLQYKLPYQTAKVKTGKAVEKN